MSVRVQVIMDECEKTRLAHQARREGLSLSAWLYRAGKEKLERSHPCEAMDSLPALNAFFADCDQREQGREPDWEDHLNVVDRSRGSMRPAS